MKQLIFLIAFIFLISGGSINASFNMKDIVAPDPYFIINYYNGKVEYESNMKDSEVMKLMGKYLFERSMEDLDNTIEEYHDTIPHGPHNNIDEAPMEKEDGIKRI